MSLWAVQRAEREQRVLEVARSLIAERGYDGVSMRELAARSRVSVPTLYKHFGDKSNLLMTAVEEQFTALLTLIDRRRQVSGVELLLAIPEGCAREIRRQPRYSRAVLAIFVGSHGGGVRAKVADHLTDEFELALQLMRERRQLADWVDLRALAERLASHQIMVCLEWASGQMNGKAMAASMTYGACLMVRGVARGAAVARLEEVARDAQPHPIHGSARPHARARACEP